MSNQLKQYRLLKDLPDAKAGTILTFDGNDCYDYDSARTSDIGKTNNTSWYRKDFVENNSEWFQPVDEFVWTDELVWEFSVGVKQRNDKLLWVDVEMEKFKARGIVLP